MDKSRYDIEYQTLNRYFPRKFAFVNMGKSDAYLDVGIKTNSGKVYRLKIMIANSFPNSVPAVYVSHPNNLSNYNGKKLQRIGVSSSMHLLSPKGDQIQLCHYKTDNWSPMVTLYKVVLKCRVWFEAYEGHLRTGEPIDYFLSHDKIY